MTKTRQVLTVVAAVSHGLLLLVLVGISVSGLDQAKGTGDFFGGLLMVVLVDAVYSGTQKCLSCPPGFSPVSLSPAAMSTVAKRKTKVQNWYLDSSLLSSYWGQERVYHHTAPISMNYGLHEALRLVLVEGIENRWQRHEQNHHLLRQGLGSLGLEIVSQAGHQLWQLNAVGVPAGVDELAVRKELLASHNIEIGAGLGPLKGKFGASA